MDRDPVICSGPHCGNLFMAVGDDWYRVDRMHDDRIGDGTHKFCSRECVIEWVLRLEDIGKTPILKVRAVVNPDA